MQCGESEELIKVVRTTKENAEYEHVEIYKDVGKTEIVSECLNIKTLDNDLVDECEFCAAHYATYSVVLMKDEASGVEGWANDSKIEIFLGDQLYKSYGFSSGNESEVNFNIISTSWYNEESKEFVIMNAGQLAGFAKLVDEGNTFAGKTVKLGANIDLENKLFNPIGSYRFDKAFSGIFDGQGFTISNLSQNTWELDNGYYYGDLGLGLFGLVENAIIKNLKINGADISGESAICGTIAGCAYGNCTFENIDIRRANVADYQYYSGAVVGWASGNHEYVNINIDKSTTIASQWGDFDNSNGGMIGGAGGSAKIHMKNCNVACRMDAYNDVTSTYQWYAYRRSGMLIGNTNYNLTKENNVHAAAPQLTCENVLVTYNDWANYHYCEFAGTSWPYVRVEIGISTSAYYNPRYGHPTDANGNVVVDDNHVHNEGEDHMLLIQFDQLYGGSIGDNAYGPIYGTSTHPGVTIN